MPESAKITISRGYLQLMPHPVLRTQSIYSSEDRYQKQPGYLEEYPDINLLDGCEIYIPKGEKGSPETKLCMENVIEAFQNNFRPNPDHFAYAGTLGSAPHLPADLLTLCRQQMDAMVVCRVSNDEAIQATLAREAINQGSVGGSADGYRP